MILYPVDPIAPVTPLAMTKTTNTGGDLKNASLTRKQSSYYI
jgi:hypothetical protein